jgi:hypothetical protein
MTLDTIPETVCLLETSYDEDLGSSQTEVSNKPWRDFSLFSSPPPPMLVEEDLSDSSVDDESVQQDPIEVRLSADDSLDSISFFTPENKHVRFSTVEIREYAVIVGDHPCCSAGLPLSLDWKYNPVPTIRQVKEFSGAKRPPQKLSLLERMHLLKNFHSSADLWMMEGERRHQQDLEEEQVAVCQQVDAYECITIVEPDDFDVYSCLLKM